MSHPTFSSVTPALIDALCAIVGTPYVSTRNIDRQARSIDVSGHLPHASDVVVWAQNAAQVAQILKLASQQRVPVTPWGAGSSVEGNPIPVQGGILLSLEQMDHVIAIHGADMQATVQAGVKFRVLNAELQPQGLFFACNTGGDATIGGLLANNAAGPKAVKYGAAKDNVLHIQVALADGRLIECGCRSIKQSSGYDLTHLFVGSEGTLGVITEATVKLMPIPQHVSAVLATFPSVQAAIDTVVAMKRSGLDAGALEFMGAEFAEFLNQTSASYANERALAMLPTLFMEFYAPDAAALATGLQQVRQLCQANAAIQVQATSDPHQREQLWAARYAAYTTCQQVFAGQRLLTTDTAVPLSAYAALVGYIEAELKTRALRGFLLGHAGDGNMHVILPYADAATEAQVMAFNAALVERSLQLGGTSTGEHGVGLGKRAYMRREHGPALDVMRDLKKLFDPHGVLNPGKIFEVNG
ncbi:MAG: FAD-binding oxidoreductase [Chloroflexi bacterium]|nr:FAD-binding oxidoreductase [Chloroflexota bacterium]